MGSRGAGSGRAGSGRFSQGGVTITKTPSQKDFDKMPALQREKVKELQRNALNSAAVENPQFAITKDDVYIAFTRSVDGGTSVVGIDKAGNVEFNTGVPDFRPKTAAEKKRLAAAEAETERILNQAYTRNKHSDQWAKAYRKRRKRG